MLGVNEIRSLEKKIRAACEYRVKTRIKELAASLNREMTSNEELREAIYKAVINRMVNNGIYFYTTDYNNKPYIRVGDCCIDYNSHLPKGKRRLSADECEAYLTDIYLERDLMLDIIYSRPSDEDLKVVYDYIIGGQTTIECAK